MEVVGQLVAVETAGAGGRAGAAVALIDEDQIEVAVIAHLAAAEFPQTQERKAARLAGAWALRQIRPAKALAEGRLLQLGNLYKERFGQIAQGTGGCLEGVFAKNVAHADAQQLLVLKAVQDRLGIGRALAKIAQFSAQLLGVARLVEHEAVKKLVAHAWII